MLNEDHEYKLWGLGKKVKKNSVKLNDAPFLPTQLNSIDMLKKLLGYLKHISSHENDQLPSNNPTAIQEAISVLEGSDCCTDSKILFIIDNVYSTSLNQYSLALLAFSMMLQNTSPTHTHFNTVT